MIRRMRLEDKDGIRELFAKLDYEDQVYWRKQPKTLEECLAESRKLQINEEVKGKSIIFVAEEDGMIVGLCWCTIVDRGIDKQGEVAEFYVKEEFRGKGIGKDLIAAATQLFIDEQVQVAFVWTHQGNKSVIELYKNAGFKEVDQLIMALIPSNKDKAKNELKHEQEGK